LNALVPRPRWGRGVTQGIESWGRVLGISGPIRKGSLRIAEALDYPFERAPAKTAAGARVSLRRQRVRLELSAEGAGPYDNATGAQVRGFLEVLWGERRK
jgi:hypothetical protein